MSGNLSRLLYLAAEHRPDLPQNGLLKYVPQGAVLQSIAQYGVRGASANLSIPLQQLKGLYKEGQAPGRGSLDEFKMILAEVINGEIELRRDDLSLKDYLMLVKSLTVYLYSKSEDLVETAEIDLGQLSEKGTQLNEAIIKWPSGLEPVDLVLGGFYQGLITVMARTGSGKTSLMLTLAGELRRTNIASSIWFFESEITKSMMEYRIAPLASRVKFHREKDKLHVGFVTMDDVFGKVRAEPDENRVIFIDSPDVLAGGMDEGRRFLLEDFYRQMVKLKGLCKAVFAASQVRRRDRVITIDSASEAVAKIHYSDIVLGLTRAGRLPIGTSLVQVSVIKNRFGPSENSITFGYDYSDLSWSFTEGDRARFSDDGADDW